jgi:hypothetical protein
MHPFGNISCIASLDCQHEFPDAGNRYRVKKLVTKCRENVRFQTPHDGIGMTRRLADSANATASIRPH